MSESKVVHIGCPCGCTLIVECFGDGDHEIQCIKVPSEQWDKEKEDE